MSCLGLASTCCVVSAVVTISTALSPSVCSVTASKLGVWLSTAQAVGRAVVAAAERRMASIWLRFV